MTSVWKWANPQLRDLTVYEPGKPIEETARELKADPSDIIKLASNENPLGPAPRALKAMGQALQAAHLYPDGGGYYLRNALAQKLGVAPQNLILGNGSNEIIEFAGHAFLNPGDNIVTPKYSFIAYKLVAHLFACDTIETPAPNFQPDLDALLAAITAKTKIVFIANPNNPTGTLVPAGQMEKLLSRIPKNVLAVFDEAYFEFLDQPFDLLAQIRNGHNILLLRTFSKVHGLASLRVGYGIGSSELIEVLQKTRQPFNVNAVGQAGALAALEDEQHLARTKQLVDTGRAWLEQQFHSMKLKFAPSAGNFVSVDVGDGMAVFKKLLAKKIIVRPLRGYGLPEWLRITVGTMEQNEKCIAALKQILS